jgi:hypothetical protein
MAKAPKTQKTAASVATFLNSVEDPQQRKDAKAISKIMAEVSGEKPAMWGAAIVGYGSYKAGANDWPLIGFSPRKGNLTLYAKSAAPGMDAFLKKLGKHKAGKGCVYIKTLSDVDETALRALMAATVKYMREKFR